MMTILTLGVTGILSCTGAKLALFSDRGGYFSHFGGWAEGRRLFLRLSHTLLESYVRYLLVSTTMMTFVVWMADVARIDGSMALCSKEMAP